MSSVCHWRTDRPYTRSYSRCQRPCGHRLRERRCLPHARGEPWPWGPWVSLHVMRTRSGDLSHMRGPIFLRDRPFVSLTRNAPIERGLMRPLRGSSRPAGHGPADAADPVRRSAQLAVRRQSHFPRQSQPRRPIGGGGGLGLRGLAAVGAGVFTAPPTEAGRGFDCLPRALRDGGPVGCRLQAFLPAWAAITDDKFVLSVIRNGFVIGLTESLPGGALRAPTRREGGYFKPALP